MTSAGAKYPWDHHVAAALQGIDEFRAFLEKLIQRYSNLSNLHVITLSIKNSQSTAVQLVLEPVAESYELPSGATYEVVLLYDRGETPLVESSAKHIIIWGWDLWGIEAFHNGAALFEPEAGWTPPADEL